jgi:carbon storage regulator
MCGFRETRADGRTSTAQKTKTLCRPARQTGGRFSTAEDIMLILTRKPGESIRIGDEIIVVVKSISGKTVRLGIAAPSSVGVYREELYAQIQETQAAKEEESASPDGIDPSEDLPPAHDSPPSNPHQITLLVEEKSS